MSVLLSDTVKTIPDPDTVSPGFAGFLVVFLIALATVVLIRSMVGHLRKVRYLAPPEDDVPGGPGGAGATDVPDVPGGSAPGRPADRRR